MTKEQLLQKVDDDLKTLTVSVAALKEVFGNKDAPDEKAVKKQEPEKLAITLEQVRSVLADKSRNGYTAEVRSLITSYGAERLSEIAPENYEALLKAAEVLGK